jgi:hypothetical protein
MENAWTKTSPIPDGATPGEGSHDLIRRVCRGLTALAWTAVVLWILAPRGSRWAGAAFDAGLAWILLTGGGYFAEQTVRSFVEVWKAFAASFDEDTTCRNKGQTRR